MGRVLLVACTSVGRTMIECIINNERLVDVDLVGIVNLRPDAACEKANYDTYIDLINKYNLNYYYCKNVNEDECIQFMKECKPDVIIQSGWSQKFSEEILRIPVYSCIGEHPAPLPKGRGAACVNWAIITGEREWGDSFFKMEMTYDTGVIYAQEKFTIEIYDDVKTVYDKVALTSEKILSTHLKHWVKGIFEETLQDNTVSTHYPRRKPSDGEFNFSQKRMDIYNQIRGQTKPYPGAFFNMQIGGEFRRVTVWSASLDATEKEDGGWNMMCGDGKYIRLLRVQMEGNPEAWAKDVFQDRSSELKNE